MWWAFNGKRALYRLLYCDMILIFLLLFVASFLLCFVLFLFFSVRSTMVVTVVVCVRQEIRKYTGILTLVTTSIGYVLAILEAADNDMITVHSIL